MNRRISAARVRPLALLLTLCTLPLAGAIAGAMFDERTHLGYTNWKSACRAAGFSFRSVLFFSFELLPTTIVGLLTAGLALQVIGFALRHRGRHSGLCLAAHAGCAVSMPVGMSLCALALPLSVMLITDVLLAFAAAWLLSGYLIRKATY